MQLLASLVIAHEWLNDNQVIHTVLDADFQHHFGSIDLNSTPPNSAVLRCAYTVYGSPVEIPVRLLKDIEFADDAEAIMFKLLHGDYYDQV
ncbi:hypothetical protein BG58_11010 [Caballeronia jiangsuensis]|nr:hypothetical protein BG58_11010 [Caballeronia jiangsuensis]